MGKPELYSAVEELLLKDIVQANNIQVWVINKMEKLITKEIYLYLELYLFYWLLLFISFYKIILKR